MTVAPAVQGQKASKYLAEKNLEEFNEVLDGTGMAYCNIETDNTTSIKNIEERGYTQVGEFVSGYMSRLWLWGRKSNHVRPATEADKDRILELLQRTYGDFNFTDFDPETFDPTDSYYVWEENGRILAVINGKKQHWQFRKLKSWLPAWVTSAIRFIPPLWITFNLKNLHFIKLGAIAFEPGQEKTARRLGDSVMAETCVRAAWGFFGKKGRVFQDLKKVHAFGRVGLLNLVQETKVRTYAYGFNEESREI